MANHSGTVCLEFSTLEMQMYSFGAQLKNVYLGLKRDNMGPSYHQLMS